MRDERVLISMILLLAAVFLFSACQKSAAENARISPSSAITSTTAPTSSKIDTSIRKIDFTNFTFPLTPDQGGKNGETFTLVNGQQKGNDSQTEATFRTIEYGDVTGDRIEEAMMSIYPYSGGNCQCEMIFIYTLVNGKPKLLWSFDTFDKAVGGFKRIYAENGELVIEIFGDSKYENEKWEFRTVEGKFKGYCCPTVFTRNRFKWNGEKFVVAAIPEAFDYDHNKINKY